MSLIRFMNSSVAGRIDKGFFLCEASSNVSVISEIEEEFGKTNYGNVKFSENEIYWMGYLYRYWCYTYCTIQLFWLFTFFCGMSL